MERLFNKIFNRKETWKVKRTAFLCCKSCVLNSVGYDAKTHSGLVSEFGLRLIKENA